MVGSNVVMISLSSLCCSGLSLPASVSPAVVEVVASGTAEVAASSPKMLESDAAAAAESALRRSSSEIKSLDGGSARGGSVEVPEAVGVEVVVCS